MRATTLFVLFLLTFVSAQDVATQVFATTSPWFSNTVGTVIYSYCTNTPNKGQTPCPATPEAQARWGRPQLTSQNSGLGFDGTTNVSITLISSGGSPTASADFFLGTLTHFNWAVYLPATATQLNLDFSLVSSTGALLTTTTFEYGFLIDETINRIPPPCPFPSGNTPCSDKISFVNSGFDYTKSFTINQANFTLQLLGFKETPFSGSTPTTYFISQEDNLSQGYLFARLQLACPSTCLGGGNFITTANGECSCDCTAAAPCPYAAQVYNPDCTCKCPASSACASGGTQNANCSCNCPACPFPKVADANCNCQCPSTFCTCGLLVSSTPNCTCDCTQCPTCTGANFAVEQDCTCNCTYNDALCMAINPKYVEDPRPAVCGCVCSAAARAACTGNFYMDEQSCQCVCPANLCPNGQSRNATSCTCGQCEPTGNWTKDPVSGLCTVCGLSSDKCTTGESLDLTVCQCVCNTLVCNTFANGLVVDTSAFCACRNCTAGECVCGNGKVEPGEQCEASFVGDPCCVNCKFTTDVCTDGNACTANDFCNGAGVCVGSYKCALNNDCRNITCDPAVGTCNQNNKPPGFPCGADLPGLPGQKDLCSRRCESGVCQEGTVICPDSDTTDCVYPTCLPSTGLCNGVADSPDNTTCSDLNSCTFSDQCVSGVCVGQPKRCDQAGNPCAITICLSDTGLCVSRPLAGDILCNADDNNCTVGDYCLQGVCTPGDPVQCPDSEVCAAYVCNIHTSECDTQYLNSTCNDENVCTENDQCVRGQCIGQQTDNTRKKVECGATPAQPVPPDNTLPIIIITVSTAAAAIGAIVGLAFLIKKVRDSRLLDPDTWNPDTFSSVGANPLYKGSIKSVDNRLYEGKM